MLWRRLDAEIMPANTSMNPMNAAVWGAYQKRSSTASPHSTGSRSKGVRLLVCHTAY